ncbi:MAG TPA: tryptophan--tRNA ligase [Gammaproteobacteria bacterium]|nr:tryptophan--tRNA ligase [Gammaproteobacteria bacterium]
MTKNKIQSKPRLLTGDTPTGRLHLGHWVGSVENRVLMQDDYDCYFLIANVHAFTTRADKPEEIHQSVLDILLDYLAVGIDPKRSTIFLQSEIAAIADLTFFFSMLVPFPRLMRNPTIKDEIRDKGLGDNYSFGFLLYPIGQVADILAFRPEVVPVGEDQAPHLEMTREVARRFNQLYCGVDPHAEDEAHLAQGGLFPVVETKLGRSQRLVGIGPPNAEGKLLKMSKSLNNAIFLSDDPDTIAKKVKAMYTDPKRLKVTDPGTVENNPLWVFHETFNPDQAWVEEAKQRYREGKIGDVECKKRLIDVLVDVIGPFRQKRLSYENHLDHALAILREGTEKANVVATETANLAKAAMKQKFF